MLAAGSGADQGQFFDKATGCLTIVYADGTPVAESLTWGRKLVTWPYRLSQFPER